MEAKVNHCGGICPAPFPEPHRAALLYPTLELHTHYLVKPDLISWQAAPGGAGMDDIHAPTVSSGPTSSGYANGIPKEQLSLQELITEKDRVETELKALGQVLDSVSISCMTCRD